MTKPKRKVLRVTVSPMNERIWYLDLQCGHEVRVIQARKPKAKAVVCPECNDDEFPIGSTEVGR